MNAVRGEFARMRATRLPLWTLLAAVCCGGLLPGALAIVGPENANPPMPGLETPEGAALLLGLGGVLLFVPALIGTLAVTGEYRHRTIGTTLLAVPRRGVVLGAKLVAYAVLGLAYGIVSSLTAGLVLVGAAGVRGVRLGIPADALVTVLAQLALAAAAYMLIGAAIGAIARNTIVAMGIVLGYFYFLEYVLMLIPGVNALYPYLPGGATASLTRFTFLTDAIAAETSLASAPLLSPPAGAAVLVAYALAAAAVAVLVPLRRDLR
ncbi:ABC transporter permease subunit [Microbacterium kyungheense]|uniref:ABC-type transport system involved in multi-copper enzyme maturation permease subunit n=1 Tax=Microbacterium kyungheense TaxID=1263636 RepID=A0A543FK30_9MICO|nr:ABC transporter permease subunit [Microbacterium kyungheense]TQM34201.1 ABC-type transport system involved in multi-copper enzyme maturation permease subunit [Microbacterium kyungheense]